MDWTDPTVSELVEEREAKMSSIAARFAVQMRKQATNAQGKATPGSEGPNNKDSRQSGLEEEAQKNLAVIVVDSPEQALDSVLSKRPL